MKSKFCEDFERLFWSSKENLYPSSPDASPDGYALTPEMPPSENFSELSKFLSENWIDP